MKFTKVNTKGSPFRHVVSHAPATPSTGKTFSARCSMKVSHDKVTLVWRIWGGGEGAKTPKKDPSP